MPHASGSKRLYQSALAASGFSSRGASIDNNWEQQDRMHPGTLGKGDATTREIFRVVQGMTNDDKPGTPVGCLRKRFEDNNIAFAQLDNGIHFENQFFEPLGTNPKVLLALEDAEFRDEFLVETFPGGRERLRCAGARFPCRNARDKLERIQFFAKERRDWRTERSM